ncbi:hypothetical protein ANCCAN_21157 [Ancylostoma caninum]|uniref:Uncharacterized protein n=1 Tax=Ancylostoma caninum TaxID=29170 RepID=A0A368FND3_ANCCA|nr:hypothetical protein ANCCAN_21157 [Ancylostoma caninum]
MGHRARGPLDPTRRSLFPRHERRHPLCALHVKVTGLMFRAVTKVSAAVGMWSYKLGMDGEVR